MLYPAGMASGSIGANYGSDEPVPPSNGLAALIEQGSVEYESICVVASRLSNLYDRIVGSQPVAAANGEKQGINPAGAGMIPAMVRQSEQRRMVLEEVHAKISAIDAAIG